MKCHWGLVAAMLMLLPTPKVLDPHTADDQQSDSDQHDNAPEDAYLIARNLLAIEEYLETSKTSNRKLVLMEKAWLMHWAVWALMR